MSYLKLRFKYYEKNYWAQSSSLPRQQTLTGRGSPTTTAYGSRTGRFAKSSGNQGIVFHPI